VSLLGVEVFVLQDRSTNHAIVVMDDLIFDFTQAYAIKLCRESLDWICGDLGSAQEESSKVMKVRANTIMIWTKGSNAL
jgi:hypothetical protein